MKRTLVAVCVLGILGTEVQAAPDEALPAPSPLERRSVVARFRLRAVEIEGAAAIPSGDISRALQSFIGQLVGAEELHEMLRRVDALYELRGFVGSRARMTDQRVVDGVIRIEVHELKVTGIQVSGNGWNRSQFISLATWRSGSEPINLATLQENLARLKETGLFERIDADLRLASPENQGATVQVNVVEALPFSIALSVANNRSPSIGSIRREVEARDASLLGWGDSLDVKFGDTKGLHDSDMEYLFPVVSTPLSIFARRVRSDSVVIEPPIFRDLDLVALSDTDAVGATLAMLRSEHLAASVGISRERRKTATSLLGIPFSFTPGLPGEPTNSLVTRTSFEAAWRDEGSSATTRLGYSAGNTEGVTQTSDGGGLKAAFHFDQAGLGGKVRVGTYGEIFARVEAQFAGQTLPPVERMSIGGSTTVRGYRENLMLRDSGVIASAEWRMPETQIASQARVGWGPFVDAGWGRNHLETADGLPRSIASVGIAVNLVLWKYARISAAFARPNHRNLTPHDDLQDRGIHWSASMAFP